MASQFRIIGSVFAFFTVVCGADLVIDPCDSVVGWTGSGLSIDSTDHREGTGSLAWPGSTDQIVRPPLGGSSMDLTLASHVHLWMRSATASGKKVTLTLASENPANGSAPDCYYFQITITWTGWRELWLPREAFGASRLPLGWNQIGNVSLSRSWGTNGDLTLIDTQNLRIDDLRLANQPTGQRTTFSNLLAALDDRPAIAAVRALSGTTAKRAGLAAYFRSRTAPVWTVDPAAPFPHTGATITSSDAAKAADALLGRYATNGISWDFGSAGAVDWLVEPSVLPWDAGNVLADGYTFNNQINRMAEWSSMASAYWAGASATAGAAYAQAFVTQLRTWTTSQPMPSVVDNRASSRWRTIECGIRMGQHWPEAWFRFLRAPAFTDDDIIAFVTACYEHGLYLRENHTADNWLTMEMNGLYTVGAVYPEFRSAAEWRLYAAGRIGAMTDPGSAENQFQSDGFHNEQTPGYHDVALTNIEDAVATAQLTGNLADFSPTVRDRLREAYRFIIRFSGGRVSPNDFPAPTVNDSWNVSSTWIAQRALSIWPDDSYFQWAVNRNRGTPLAGTVMGTPPADLDDRFSSSGWSVFRTGWINTATTVWFDHGRLGSHEHQDKLGLILWPYGRDLLFDGGGGNYDVSINRRYAISTQSHNAVLVDGMGQRRTKTTADPYGAGAADTPPALWTSSTDLAYAAGWYQDGWADTTALTPAAPATTAIQRRQVLFWRPQGVAVVIDDLVPRDGATHAYEARWHLRTTAAALSGNRVVTTDAGVSNLSVMALDPSTSVSTASGQTVPEFIGWDVRKGETDVACTTVRHRRQSAGPVRFVTVLAPIAAGGSDPVQSTAVIPGGWRLTMSGGSLDLVDRPGLTGLVVTWTPLSGPVLVQVVGDNTAPTIQRVLGVPAQVPLP